MLSPALTREFVQTLEDEAQDALQGALCEYTDADPDSLDLAPELFEELELDPHKSHRPTGRSR